ncbi:HAMP domain-containing histidine kinase [Belnapia sp. T6]|uniref:histidine kinase n=1 Tax=Belnapia mucosa TaxID=2804532 RepID=A0ABS1V7Y2_9PROT|nr:HAMP domain-containing sensor histidine kinase [Belnapia mucosa]MBL6456859.1 HAMP domain-containing histidine kinase [Belnapia mucosa]
MFRSLTWRLALLSALWVAFGLLVAGWLVLGIASDQLLRGLDTRVVGLLDRVAGAAATGSDGRPRLERPLSEPDLEQPFSGTYWQMATAGGARASSRSLWDARLPGFDAEAGPGPRLRDVAGPRGEALRLGERAVVPPDGGAPLLVQVALARGGVDAELRRLRWLIGLGFGLLGLGLVAGTILQVVWGLRPLRQARQAVAELRAGEREGDLAAAAAPSEIAPLLEEIDALVMQNRATVERARAHLGNLAHALKTPLAVQRAALDATPPDLVVLRAEVQAMERLVQHHLGRARAAALSNTHATGALPLAVGEDIARALRRLPAGRDLTIAVTGDARARVAVDPQDLAEMVGNLMENACQWARSRIALTVAREGAMVRLLIEDDGPGLPEEERERVLARGVRLDEAAPGSGLGLAIARELVELHGGRLALEAGAAGGLRVRLELPAR